MGAFDSAPSLLHVPAFDLSCRVAGEMNSLSSISVFFPRLWEYPNLQEMYYKYTQLWIWMGVGNEHTKDLALRNCIKSTFK